MSDRWRVMQGDSLHLLRDLPDGCADLVLTDPPYSSGGFTRGDRTADTGSKYVQNNTQRVLQDFAGDNRDQRGFAFWCTLWMGECLRLSKPGGIIAVFADWRQQPTVTDCIQAAGWVWRGTSVWVKPDGRPQPGRPVADAEFIVWGTRGGRTMEGPVGPRHHLGTSPRDRQHQTEKPVDLLKPWCELAPLGGLVLDPFAGSGSTGEAALLTGRRFLGVELTAHYAEVARARLAAIGEHGEAVSAEQPSLFGGGQC